MSQPPRVEAVSLFRQMVRRRMERTNDQWGDHVPWDLDDKFKAYEFVRTHDWKTPRVERFANLAEALTASRSFGKRVVVKQPNLHSSRGIWVLEKIDDERFLDLLTGRVITEKEITPLAPAPDHWLVEEFLEPSCRGATLPLDYKVYAFRGIVTHVMQMDRSVWPVRTAAFDGCFVPMPIGQEIHLNPGVYRPQGHVIPLHASEILAMASELSRNMDTDFVRVDCYDTLEGPVFGEFTFTPGSEDVATIRYTGRVAEAMDKALKGLPCPPLSGFDIDLAAFMNAIEKHRGPVFSLPPEVYALISATAILADSRYAKRLGDHVCGDAIGEHFSLAARLVGLLNGDTPQAAAIKSAIEAKAGFIKGDQRLKQFAEIAANFEKKMAELQPTQPRR